MSELHFQLLGSLQVWRGDQRIDNSLSSQRLKTVLARFLTEFGRFVAAEQLIEALWPDRPPAKAINSLQVAVSQLRRWLEPALQRGDRSRYLQTEGEGYRFLCDRCAIDVNDFNANVQSGLAALRSEDFVVASRTLERARALYRGDFLADFPYAEWVFAQREQLRESNLNLLVALVGCYLSQGRYSDAIVVAQQGLHHDELREIFYRQLMQSYGALGQRSRALAAYERCRIVLAQQWQLSPGQETEALRAAIVSGRHLPALAPAAETDHQLDLPLVGRAAALERLQGAMRRNTPVVLVSGDAGLGKTRLLQQFTARHDLLWAGARQEDGPFALIIDAFRAFLQRRPPPAKLRTLGPLAGPLAQVAPALHDLWPACPHAVPLTPTEERQRLQQALLAGLNLAARQVQLLILEDVHWAGDASLALVTDLLAGEGRPQLTVLSIRSGELATNHALRRWLDSVRRAHDVVEIELDLLTEADVAQALRTLAGIPDLPAFARRLTRITGGHPLFLVETLRALLDNGLLYRDADGWHLRADLDEAALVDLALSDSLRAAILARAGQLAAAERELVDAIAVLDRYATGELLARLLQLDSKVVGAALEHLAARRLVEPHNGGWRFTHQLIADTFYDALPASHSRLLHRLAARTLSRQFEAQASPATAVIMRHLLASDGDPVETARWAIRAGEWAYRHYDHVRSRQHFEVALVQLERLPSAVRPQELMLQAYEGAGQALRLTGDPHAGLAALERALAIATTLDDRSRLLLSMTRICEKETGEYERALALLAGVESDLRAAGAAGRAELMSELLATRAGILFWGGNYQAGLQTAEQALALADERSERPALKALAINLHKLGRVDEAAAIHRQLLKTAQQDGHRPHIAEAYNLIGMSESSLGRVRQALAAFEASRDINRELAYLRGESIAETNIGGVAATLGDLAHAEEAQRRAIRYARQVNAPYTEAHAGFHLGYVLALRGRWREARVQFEQALALARAIDAQVVEAQVQLYYGRYYFWPRAEVGQAQSSAASTLEMGERLGDNFCRREGRLLMALLQLHADEVDAAQSLAEEALAIARNARQLFTEARALRVLGRIQAARQLPDAATTLFGESAQIFRKADATVELGETLLAQAEAFARVVAREDERNSWLREARRYLRAAGALPLLRRVQAQLASDS